MSLREPRRTAHWPLMTRTVLCNLGLAALLVWADVARADSIYLLNPDGSPALQPFRDNITILRQADRSLVFRTASGLEQSIEFDKVARITVTADPSLTEGDDAYIGRQYDRAVDAYLKALRTNDAWKVHWITPRLSKAAAATNRFDAALAAYVGFARIDPPSAVASKPTLPAKGSRFLDDAVKQLDAELRTAASDAQRQALLSLLLDIHARRGDTAATEATANALMALAGEATDPRVAEMVTGIRIDQASREIDAGRFAPAIKLLDSVRGRTIEPPLQARLLFELARAQRGEAGNDPQRRIDAALAFLRVAAHFSSVEGKPFVADALLEAARTLEAAGDAGSARRLYEQIGQEFPDTPQSAQASAALRAMDG